MSLEERLQKDLVAALKEHNESKTAAIRSVKAAIQNEKTNGKFHELTDADVIKIINKQIKQREESIQIYKDNGRTELADNETAEMKVLEEYVPKKLSDEELEKVIKEAISAVGASSVKDKGNIMKYLGQNYTGQYDGKKASDLISTML